MARAGLVAGRAATGPWKTASRRSTKLRTPSAASSLASTGGQQPGEVLAGRGQLAAATRALARVALHAQRRLRGDQLGERARRRVELPAGRHDLLHEADAERLGGAELLAGQQEAHRVAPAELGRGAEGGAAERQDAAAHLELAEAHVVGGDDDVARPAPSSMESVKAMPWTASTTGLGTGGRQSPNGSCAARAADDRRAALGHGREHLGEVEPG